MEQVNVKCGTLHHIKRNTGKITDCIFAKLLHKKTDINLTYDCNSSNLVIHEWYKLSTSELDEITEELKQFFKKMAAK